MSGGGHRKDGVVTIYSETIQILIVEQRHRCADQHYGDCLPCGVQRTHGCCGKRGTCGSGRASRSGGIGNTRGADRLRWGAALECRRSG